MSSITGVVSDLTFNPILSNWYFKNDLSLVISLSSRIFSLVKERSHFVLSHLFLMKFYS